VEGTRVLVFYPHGGVSQAQRLQMITQEGTNVDACAVRGNFDDAQTGVKQIFALEGDRKPARPSTDGGFRVRTL
jgi:threonine synthase